MSIDIPDDGLLAIIRAINPDTTLEFVLEFLGQNGVTFGTDEDTIRKAIDQAKDSGQSVRDVAVAKGVEPRHPAPPRMEHRPPGGLDSLPGLGPVAKALKLESPQELVESVKDLTVLPVASGDTLAELVHDAGEPGKNVRGEAVDPPPIETEMESEALQPGSGVDRDGDGRYHATHWGYAGVLEGKVTVLAPIWIAPDGMVASLLHRPYEGPEPSSPTVDDLTTALGSCNVTVGIEPDWLQKVVDRLAEGTVVRIMVPLARGVEPESSEDGRIDFSFPPDTLAGTIAADGSINLKERNLFPGVEEGELLAETVPPVVGTPGKSVRDEIVEETLYSHLLKSNCPVTGQPDWGSVLMRYKGPKIDREGLLRYLIGFRQHQDFHEHCVETVFTDLMGRCNPESLTVVARYTRRGGLDINPWRSTETAACPVGRAAQTCWKHWG